MEAFPLGWLMLVGNFLGFRLVWVCRSRTCSSWSRSSVLLLPMRHARLEVVSCFPLTCEILFPIRRVLLGVDFRKAVRVALVMVAPLPTRRALQVGDFQGEVLAALVVAGHSLRAGIFRHRVLLLAIRRGRPRWAMFRGKFSPSVD